MSRCDGVQATADLERGKAMYEHYTQVPDSLLPVRDLVILNRKARGMFVQVRSAVAVIGRQVRVVPGETVPHLCRRCACSRAPSQPHTSVGEGNTVSLATFEPTVDGVIDSFVARFPVRCVVPCVVPVGERACRLCARASPAARVPVPRSRRVSPTSGGGSRVGQLVGA